MPLHTGKGKAAEGTVSSPCDTVAGLQQNMLQTVTSVERYHGIWKRQDKRNYAMNALIRTLFMAFSI